MAANREQLERWHFTLQQVRDMLIELADLGYRNGFPEGMSSDSVFALGQATGVIDKARALLGRDIDQLPE